jgi:hypothetical protein
MNCTDSCPIIYSNALLKKLGASLSPCFKPFLTLNHQPPLVLSQYDRQSVPLLLLLNASIHLNSENISLFNIIYLFVCYRRHSGRKGRVYYYIAITVFYKKSFDRENWINSWFFWSKSCLVGIFLGLLLKTVVNILHPVHSTGSSL